jgi:hypothetical protein
MSEQERCSAPVVARSDGDPGHERDLRDLGLEARDQRVEIEGRGWRLAPSTVSSDAAASRAELAIGARCRREGCAARSTSAPARRHALDDTARLRAKAVTRSGFSSVSRGSLRARRRGAAKPLLAHYAVRSPRRRPIDPSASPVVRGPVTRGPATPRAGAVCIRCRPVHMADKCP